MKKILALLLTLAMVFALCACGQTAAPAASEAPAEESAEAPAGDEITLDVIICQYGPTPRSGSWAPAWTAPTL